MVWIIDEIRDFIASLPTWQKWLGTSIGGVLIFFFLLLVFAGPQETKQVAGIPMELKQIESNVTKEYIQESRGPALEIIGSFWRTGEDMAKEVRDPASAKAVFVSAFRYVDAILQAVCMRVHQWACRCCR